MTGGRTTRRRSLDSEIPSSRARSPIVEPRTESGRGRGIAGHDDVIEHLARCAVDDDPQRVVVGRLHPRHGRGAPDHDTPIAQHRREPFEDSRVAPGHVAEHLVLQPAAARRVQPLDRGPDERGVCLVPALPELGPQQRKPEALERRAPGPAREPGLDGLLLEPLPVLDARAVRGSCPRAAASTRAAGPGAGGSPPSSTPTRAARRRSSRSSSRPSVMSASRSRSAKHAREALSRTATSRGSAGPR